MVTRSSIPYGVPGNRRKLRLYNVDMNPYCDRVKLILDAKRITYEIIDVNLENPPQSLFDVCPECKIPTLELTDLPGALYESIIIVDYLEEAYPSIPIYALDAYRKGEDRILIEKFNAIIVGLLKAFDTQGTKGGSAVMENLLYFEGVLADRGTDFFGGRHPGFVDYMIWPWIERMAIVRLMDEEFFNSRKDRIPLLIKWGTNMKLDPAVKKNSRPVGEYYNYYIKKNSNLPSDGI